MRGICLSKVRCVHLLQVHLKNTAHTRGMSCISGEGVIYLHSAMTRHCSHSVAQVFKIVCEPRADRHTFIRCEWHWVSFVCPNIGLLRFLLLYIYICPLY